MKKDIVECICRHLDKESVDNLSLSCKMFYCYTLSHKLKTHRLVVNQERLDILNQLCPLFKHIRWHFNQPVTAGAIPPSVTHLTFGGRFNQPVDHLNVAYIEINGKRYRSQKIVPQWKRMKFTPS